VGTTGGKRQNRKMMRKALYIFNSKDLFLSHGKQNVTVQQQRNHTIPTQSKMAQRAPYVVSPLGAIRNRNHFYKEADTGCITGP
jgi:hypothetical protein